MHIVRQILTLGLKARNILKAANICGSQPFVEPKMALYEILTLSNNSFVFIMNCFSLCGLFRKHVISLFSYVIMLWFPFIWSSAHLLDFGLCYQNHQVHKVRWARNRPGAAALLHHRLASFNLRLAADCRDQRYTAQGEKRQRNRRELCVRVCLGGNIISEKLPSYCIQLAHSCHGLLLSCD